MPDNYRLVSEHGELKGIAHAQDIELRRANLFEGVYRALEEEIPPRIQWINGEEVIERLKISEEPLCVWTPLMEDETGIHPRITRRPRS